jgi:nucleoid DNA-binding protein
MRRSPASRVERLTGRRLKHHHPSLERTLCSEFSCFSREKTVWIAHRQRFMRKNSQIPLKAVKKALQILQARLLSFGSESQGDTMATQLSKSQLIERIATATELSKRDVKNVMDNLVDVGHKELKKNGLFLVPGFAKFVVVKKPATKARKGVNPFTGEEMMFKAKPARKIVRARPVKAAKDAV